MPRLPSLPQDLAILFEIGVEKGRQVVEKCLLAGSVTTIKKEHRTCEDCSLFRLCFTHELAADELATLESSAKSRQSIGRNQHLFHAGQRMKSVQIVRSGSVKSYQISADGEEVISGFFLPGEVIGLDALATEIHPSFAVALEDSETCEIPISEFLELLQQSPKLNEVMIRLLSEEMAETRALLLVVGRLDAKTRVALFLLSLSQRVARRRQDPNRLKLSMDRRDIANYLGLTIETVSRTLSGFQRDHIIAVHGKQIHIKDHRALEKIARPGGTATTHSANGLSQSTG